MPDTEFRITQVKGGRRHGQELWLDQDQEYHKISHMGYSEIYRIKDGIAVYQRDCRSSTALGFLNGKKMKEQGRKDG